MNQKKKGFIQIAIWALLIIAGIVSKRIYSHPEWMMLFHGPAAVFLVVGMRNMSNEYKKRYSIEAQRYLTEQDVRVSEANL